MYELGFRFSIYRPENGEFAISRPYDDSGHAEPQTDLSAVRCRNAICRTVVNLNPARFGPPSALATGPDQAILGIKSQELAICNSTTAPTMARITSDIFWDHRPLPFIDILLSVHAGNFQGPQVAVYPPFSVIPSPVRPAWRNVLLGVASGQAATRPIPAVQPALADTQKADLLIWSLQRPRRGGLLTVGFGQVVTVSRRSRQHPLRLPFSGRQMPKGIDLLLDIGIEFVATCRKALNDISPYPQTHVPYQ